MGRGPGRPLVPSARLPGRSTATGDATSASSTWWCAVDRTVVFVEVKARPTDHFGAASSAVDHRKQRRLRVLAARWFAEHPDRHGRGAVRRGRDHRRARRGVDRRVLNVPLVRRTAPTQAARRRQRRRRRRTRSRCGARARACDADRNPCRQYRRPSWKPSTCNATTGSSRSR